MDAPASLMKGTRYNENLSFISIVIHAVGMAASSL